MNVSSREQRSTPNMLLVGLNLSTYHHPVQRQSDCVYSPFQEIESAPDAAGWAVESELSS